MSRSITVQSLALLNAINTLGPEVPTANAAMWVSRNMPLALATQGGTKRPSLDGGLRQALRAHERAGRVKHHAIDGHGRSGKIYVWTITAAGRKFLESTTMGFVKAALGSIMG